MANDLTGDFDVVAEFSIPAANRVLAAMHRGGRVPHSWTLRVDDYNHLRVPFDSVSSAATITAGIRAITDGHGQAATDPVAATQVSNHASAFRGSFDTPVNVPTAAPVPAGHRFTDSVQDASARRIPDLVALEKASHLMGIAQVQMGAPTISFGRSDTSIIVHTPVMARYTSDAGYMEIPDLLRGEFQTTIQVQQVSSSAGMFIDVKLGGKNGDASFVPKWVSPAWDNEPDQLGAINKAIVNALKGSFEPSSTQVPASIPIMNFKTLSGGSQPALAIMMDVPGGVLTGEFLAALLASLGGPPPPIADPATVTNVFLGQDDDFALAICSNDIIKWFADAVNSAIPGQQNFSNTTTAEALGTFSYTFHTYTTITVDDAIITLQPGQIVVRVNVHVHFSNDSSYVPSPDDFDFTITQAFNLALNGGSVSLQALGPLDVAIPPDVNSSIASFAKTNATNAFNNAWGSAGGSVQALVSKSLSVDNLQNFLKSMMNPAPKPGSAPLEEIDPKMLYTRYEITPSGIVLHGVLQVPAWTKPQVNFSVRTFRLSPNVPLPVTEYSALNSWIPGGTISEYIWNQQGGPVLHDDHNTFLFSRRNGQLFHVCLTAKGSRITSSGPITYQAVSGDSLFCGWHMSISAKEVSVLDRALLPDIALTRKSDSNGLEVLGHTSPWADKGSLPENTTNLIVHFPDEHSLSRLEYLPRDLEQASHENSSAAIIVVLSPDELKKASPVDGIVFSDDEKGWSKLVHLKHRPATFLIDTAGDVSWQHQGPMTNTEFVTALRAHLPTVGGFAPRLVQPNVRVGSSVPNFIFETAPGQTVTLRKLMGRPAVLVFWKSTSQASIEAIRDLVDICGNSGRRAPVVLAINDGEPLETVKRASEGIKAVIVPDPDRAISAAFGINLWPTSIYLDAGGLITDICYGRFCGGMQKTSSTAAAD